MTTEEREVLRLLCKSTYEVLTPLELAQLRAFAEKQAEQTRTDEVWQGFARQLAENREVIDGWAERQMELHRRVLALERHIQTHAQGATMHEDAPKPDLRTFADLPAPKPAATVEEIASAMRKACWKLMATGDEWPSYEAIVVECARVALRMKEEGRL